MAEIGYTLSAEEHAASDLVRYARRAEETGFTFAMISDHFHPWTHRQGHSPFVWSVLGGIAQATERLRVGTGVTCPTIRIHPGIVAQAAATVATMMPGRFFLGVGSGENLNEHIFGDAWPAPDERLEMLAEAIVVIRLLWRGEEATHRGVYYTLENARLYDVPKEPPPLMVAGWGRKALELAARMGDGLISTQPDAELIATFDGAGGRGKPRYGQVHVCWAPDDDTAVRIANEWWPNTALPGQLGTELPSPKHFEQAAELVTPALTAEKMVCSADPERHVEAIRAYVEAGYDHVYVHQIGPDQEGFFRFYEDEILPKL